ncbi:MAG: hypothetical protein H6657_13630 [Ardenticatenaceae bacterium]|nr:hypothetical protein [Ardenticatenaceae bacterium]
MTQLLILGTYHFANPGLDMAKLEVPDMLSTEKQREITAVLTALAAFRPNKIAVEAAYDKAESLNQLYAAYRAGQHELTRNEIQQLGFRLAAQLAHEQIYAVDHHGSPIPFEAALEYAEVHHPDFLTKFQETLARWEVESNRHQQTLTVGEILRLINSPAAIAADHQIYLDFTAVGTGDNYIGAEVLAGWYDRNIRIFANLRQIMQSADRILLIYGAGHLALLRELASSCTGIELVNSLDYL